MGYDGLLRLTSVTGGPVTRQYTYRDIDSTKTTLQVASMTSGGQQYGYTYDSMGNIATFSAPGKGTVTYTYDNQGQLLKAVNVELIQMYWNVGAYLSELCSASSFGDKVIDEVSAYIAQKGPGVKGFNRRGLYRMKQFYETYKDDEFVTPLVTQISWTNHLLIMSGSKTAIVRKISSGILADIKWAT